jgi:hypothetical protein
VTFAWLLALLATPAAAQWLNYPTPGIPRTADGKPDLTAPAPRTADGKPDLSGMWQIGGLGYATNITDVEMLPWAQALFKKRVETYATDDPAVGCLPEGPRSSLAGLDPMRIVQAPNMVVILYETGTFRQIFTDGRPLPTDPNPTWMGYSVGLWEGDTLVVATAGYNDKTWLDFAGHPHSEALHVTERFRRTDFGHMQLDMTFDDPKTYAKSWTIHPTVSFVPDDDLLENVCLENEKDRARLVGKVEDDRKSGKKISVAVLSQYAGIYDLGPLGQWTVSVVGDQLAIELADGGGKQVVFAQSDTAFVFPSVGGTVTFVRDSKGVVTHFLLTIVEGDFTAVRK